MSLAPGREQLLASAASGQLRRQVFISHTGRDRDAMNFAACILKPMLEAAGLPVFMDYASLTPGCQWRNDLVAAAANSAVVVVVLSRSFTSRFWCMLELDLALHSRAAQQDSHKQLVIPVFYDTPAEVVKGNEIQNLWEHTPLEPDRRRWVDSATWAANVVAMEENKQNLRRRVAQENKELPEEEFGLAQKVVKEAVRIIPRQLPLVPVVFGIDEQKQQLLQLLEGQLGLWIYGPGGSGKSTMAFALFNHLAPEFQLTAVVELGYSDGKDQEEGHLCRLLTALGSSVSPGDSAGQLKGQLQEYVAKRKVLLLLDNVWSYDMLDSLLPTNLGEGSVVLITSRYENLGLKGRLHHHRLDLLTSDSSRDLFRSIAQLDSLCSELQAVEQKILDFCGGLPLALNLTARQLRNRKDNPMYWESVLAALQKGKTVGDTEGRLQGLWDFSVRNLELEQKSMLLDTAAVILGEPKETALAVWTHWHGKQALLLFEDLCQRCLLDVDSSGRLSMHDVLVALARRDLREHGTSFGSRLWVENGQIVGVPQGDSGGQVVAARLEGATELPSELSLPNVRILFLNGTESTTGTALLSPRSSVLWLHTNSAINVCEWLAKGKLVALGAVNNPSLSCPRLETLAESIGQLASLQQLDLSWCEQLQGLPESIGQLSNLQKLNLLRCKQLQQLPESIGQLTSLQYLGLRGCKQLQQLSESIGQLSSLQYLDLSGCKQLQQLSESIGQLSSLQYLGLRGCKQLQQLPESIGQLTSLQQLPLFECKQLQQLPESIGQLTSLKDLILLGCEQLQQLPESIGQLTSLKDLILLGCEQLQQLPESIGQLASLQELDLSGCKQHQLPESIGQLASLRQLKMTVCEQLQGLPKSIGQLTSLQQLDLLGCKQLQQLPESIGQLTSLQYLGLRGCHQLQQLPESIGQLTSLQYLGLRGCHQLQQLPESIGQLTSLQQLDLSWCEQLQGLPESIGQLTSLQQLHLSWCHQLQQLPESIGQLTSLERLDLSWCHQLQQLPESIGQLTKLQQLDLSGCEQLQGLPESIGQLTSLHEPNLYACPQLHQLPVSIYSADLLDD